MDTLHKRQTLILSKLAEQTSPITAKELSLFASVSVRTIKSDIVELNQYLNEKSIEIFSKPGEGYWIDEDHRIVLEDYFSKSDDSIIQKFDNMPKFNYERINYIIKKLLVVDYHLKLEDLVDEIFVSRSTLTQDIKKVRALLSKFRLSVVSRANYGIIIEGSEVDKRLCIAEYFFHYNVNANYSIDKENMFSTGKNKEEYDLILDHIRVICQRYNIIISDFSLNNFAIHVSIAIRRCTFYNYIKSEDLYLDQLKDTAEFKAAYDLTKLLEEQYRFMLPMGETIYYALHLQSKRIANESNISNEELRKINECISVIFLEVKNNFEVDLEEDLELYEYLYLHIPQMITRLKNHMVIRNPLVYDNLRRYLFATKVTHSACAIIENFYDVEVDINEFGYLILYFNLAITKYESKKKIRVGIVSGRGRPETIMYFNEIKENFIQEKYDIKMIENTQLVNSNINDIDFLVTTYTLHPMINIPSYVIKDDGYIEEIRKSINQLLYHSLEFNKYFKEEYSAFHMDGETKDEVLQHFYEMFEEKEMIHRGMDHKNQFKSNEIGNGIVHFQDLHRICRKGFCFIGVLKKPVLWDLDVVRVLVMIKTKKDGDKDLNALCKIISKWSNNAEKVESLIQKLDYQAFLEDIKTT